MVTLEGVNYYTQKEIAEKTGTALVTIRNKVALSKVQGIRFGRAKHYTEQQILQIMQTPTTPYVRKPQNA